MRRLSALPAQKDAGSVKPEATWREYTPPGSTAPLAGVPGVLGQFVSGATGISSILTAASGVAAAVAGLVGYFQSDFEILGQEVKPDVLAVQARLAGKLKQHCEIILPGFHELDGSVLLNNYRACQQAAQKSGASLAGLRLLALVEKAAVGGGGEDDAAIPPQTGTEALVKLPASLLGLAVVRTEYMLEQFLKLSKAITRPPEAGGPTPLAAAALRQYLKAQKVTHLLYVSVVASGADAVTRKRRLLSSERYFLGGSSVIFFLVDMDGRLVAANTQSSLARFNFKLENDTLEAGLKQSVVAL